MCQSIFSFLGENPSVEKWDVMNGCMIDVKDLEDLKFIPVIQMDTPIPLFDRLRRMISIQLCSDEGLRLLCSMLRLNPMERISIESVCDDGYFHDNLYSAVMHGEYGKIMKR